MTNNSLLHIAGLSFSYHLANGKDIHAIRQLSLTIPQGAIMGLIGESGCGKSTLCNILMQSLPYHQGTIKLHGTELKALGTADSGTRSWWHRLTKGNSGEESRTQALRRYYRRIQYVFQDPKSAMPPHLTLKHFACAPLMNLKHYSKSEAQEKIAFMMTQVGLKPTLLERYPHELSIGQLQRINLLKSLSIEPELLLCDEITSALDQESAASCLECLRDHQRQGGTCLFITHDLKVARMICDHFALMFKGSILEQWSANEQPLHPYALQLQQAETLLEHPENLESWQRPTVLSCPMSVDTLCPFLLRCHCSQERCLQEAPSEKEIGAEHTLSCHLHPA